MLSVREYAKAAGISPARVHQLIAGRKIPAQKVGRAWVIDDAALRRRPRSRRPLSPLMSALVLDALDGRRPDGIDSRRWLRALSHADAIRHSPAPAALLRDLMANRGPRVDLRAQPSVLHELRQDERVRLSGISDPRSQLSSGWWVEGHVSAEDFPALEAEYLLIRHPEVNVRLHLSGRVPALSDSIADLADWDRPREDRAVSQLLASKARD